MSRLLLVGLGDIAPADLHRQIDAGRLPACRRMVETGTSATLDVDGQDVAALWATMVTGVVPAVHGIRDGFVARADGGGIAPFGASDWRAAPVWQVLADADVPTAIVGCPGTAPATAWAGIALDERFASAPPTADRDWPLAPDCASPADLRDAARATRVAPDDLDDAMRGPLSARPMAYALGVHGAGMLVAAQADWRFLAVCYPPHGSGEAGDAFYDVLIDHLLGAAGARDDTSVVLVSTGGVVAAAGPGFAADALAHGVGAADIAASVLARFGLRVDGGAGRPLAGMTHQPLRTVIGARSAVPAARPIEAVTLIPPPAEAETVLAALAARLARHEGMEAMRAGEHLVARDLFVEAGAAASDDLELALLLAQSAFLAGDADTCRRVGERLVANRAGTPWSALLIGAADALDGHATADTHLAAAASQAGDDVDMHVRLAAIASHRGRHREAEAHYQAADRCAADRPAFRAAVLEGLGTTLRAQGQDEEAERCFKQSIGLRYHAPAVHRALGRLYADQERWAEASRAFAVALSQAPTIGGVAADLARALRHAS